MYLEQQYIIVTIFTHDTAQWLSYDLAIIVV